MNGLSHPGILPLLLALGATLVPGQTRVTSHYTAWRFDARDLRQNANGDTLELPDRVLLGQPRKISIRLSKAVPAHPAVVLVRTHFTNFEKNIGTFEKPELTFDAPPGDGWKCLGDQIDGKLHGPLRVGSIRFEGAQASDLAGIESVEILADVESAPERMVVMTAPLPRDRRFIVDIRSLLPQNTSGTLSYTYRTWDGETLARQDMLVTIPSRVTLADPPARSDLRFIEAEIRLRVAGQEIPEVRPCWSEPPARIIDPRLRPDSLFGMGIYLTRHTGDDLRRVGEMASEAGVKWSREGIPWQRSEPSPGRFDWSFFDERVDVARRNGISIYALISGWPRWVQPYTPEAIDAYCRFVQAAVSRYKGFIHHWEIWNEPNIFFWQGPKSMYNTLLERSYKAIKEVDPKAQVLGMSTSGIDYNFIARSMARGTPFDALTIHPYRKVLEEQVLMEELRLTQQLVKRPIWITEFGWAVHTPHNTLEQDFAPNSLRTQAEFLARAYLSSFASGAAPNTSWYDFRDDGDDPIYFEHNLGVLTRDLHPKPAYAAFSTMTRLLEGERMKERLPAPDGVWMLRFEPSGTLVAWSPEADIEITVPPGYRKRINLVGEESPVTGGSTLKLWQSAPIYLTVK